MTPAQQLQKRIELLVAVAAAAKRMPLETNGPGGVSTTHTYEIQSGVIWGLAKALDDLAAF